MELARKKIKRCPRWQRKNQIITILGVVFSQPRCITMSQIAFWLQMKPSNHLMKILWELREESILDATQEEYRPGIHRVRWSLTNEGEIMAQELSEKKRMENTIIPF